MAHKYCENPLSCDICVNHLNGLKYRKLVDHERVLADEKQISINRLEELVRITNLGVNLFDAKMSLSEFVALRNKVDEAFRQIFEIADPGIGNPIPQEVLDLMASDPDKD